MPMHTKLSPQKAQHSSGYVVKSIDREHVVLVEADGRFDRVFVEGGKDPQGFLEIVWRTEIGLRSADGEFRHMPRTTAEDVARRVAEGLAFLGSRIRFASQAEGVRP